MDYMTIKEIIDATKGKFIQGNIKDIIGSISTDTRRIKDGDLFIPLIGESFDGHDFIEKAWEKGAKAFLKDEKHDLNFPLENINIIEVKDTVKALGDLAKYYKNKFPIQYIGVTGSTGKTTTKDMLYAVLSKNYKTLKNEGNFNNHIGLPLTIFNLNEEYECAILEMGMSSTGEIEYLANIVDPQIGVISNIGLSHIENLGSQENILKAKLEITSNFKEEDILIVNGDDPYLKTLKNKNMSYHIKSFGFGKDNTIYCSEYKMNEGGIDITCVINEKEEVFFIPARGKHNIYNAMAGILVGLTMRLSVEQIRKGLLEFKSGKMRLDIIKKNDRIVINDAYNASPDSMKAALDILGEYKENRKIAILGDMLEMGEYAEKGHRLLGDYIKDKGDILITVGKNALYIALQAKEEGFKEENILHFNKNEEVIEYLKDILKEKDVILVKGSRGMKLEEIVEFLDAHTH